MLIYASLRGDTMKNSKLIICGPCTFSSYDELYIASDHFEFDDNINLNKSNDSTNEGIKISDLPKGRLFNIIQSDPLIPHWRFGKKIAAFFKGENITIGILNSINQLAKEIEFYPPKKK